MGGGKKADKPNGPEALTSAMITYISLESQGHSQQSPHAGCWKVIRLRISSDDETEVPSCQKDPKQSSMLMVQLRLS